MRTDLLLARAQRLLLLLWLAAAACSSKLQQQSGNAPSTGDMQASGERTDGGAQEGDAHEGVSPPEGPTLPTERTRYAVVVSNATAGLAPWKEVIDALVDGHGDFDVEIFRYTRTPNDVRTAVGQFAPLYLAFVTRPEETTPELINAAHDFAEQLDADPYSDAVWGIITGFTAQDALALAAPAPIEVRSGLMRTGSGWLKYVQSGLYLTEDATHPGQWGSKRPATAPEFFSGGPADDSSRFVEAINSNGYDFLVGSGHGNHEIWQLMYPTGGRFMTAHTNGTLWVNDDDQKSFQVQTSNPKIYWAVGNCLTGFIHGTADGRTVDYHDSFALAWMRNGVKNYLGAAYETAYPTFWFQVNYFFALQERWTYAESIFLLRQQVHYELVHGLAATGDDYTERIMVLYGDPALAARLAHEVTPGLDELWDAEALSGNRVRLTYQVRVLAPPARVKNGESGWRVHATLIPVRTTKPAMVETSNFAGLDLTGETLVFDAGYAMQVGETKTATFVIPR